MVGWVRRACVGALALVGCGPSVASPSGEAGSSDGGETTTAVAATTTREGGTSSSSEASSTGADDSSSSSEMTSSSSGAEPPELLELEGPIHYCGDCFNPMSYLRACGFEEDWLCLIGNDADLWRCNGAYARVRGYVIPNPNGWGIDAPCGEFVVDVTEVLEARLCEAKDCGVGCSEGLDCQPTCWGPEFCEPDEKCVPWVLPGGTYGGRTCSPVHAEPAAPGEACTTDRAAPWKDNCDGASVCFDGTCQVLCGSSAAGDVDCAPESCFSDGGGFSACLPGCNPLAPQCEAGKTCMAAGGRFACLSPEAASSFEFPDCDGETCESTEICVNGAILPDCPGSGCCAELCLLSAPACPDGLECVALWSPEAEPALADVGGCFLPGSFAPGMPPAPF